MSDWRERAYSEHELDDRYDDGSIDATARIVDPGAQAGEDGDERQIEAALRLDRDGESSFGQARHQITLTQPCAEPFGAAG